MKKKLYLIVGASGSGKDYIVDKICRDFNMQRVISRTTRKPRYKGENTHIFVSNEVADKEFENAFAKTIFHGNKYYTISEDLEKSDFYIVDPNGVKSMENSNIDNIEFISIFINTPWWKRAKNMRKRGDSFKSIISRLVNDHKEFGEFKGSINLNSSTELYEYINKIHNM